jgi:hypothetical protein
MPNASVDQIIISMAVRENENGTVELMDLNGKSLLTRNLFLQQGNNTAVIDNLGDIKSGNYICKVTTMKGITYNKLRLQ